MSLYLLVKTLHILSSVVLVGTGFATAFYLFCANGSHDRQLAAGVSRWVVSADWIFTIPAAVLQPATGIALAHMAGWPLSTPWIAVAIALYAFAGACWFPVMWMQHRMAQVANAADARGRPLPAGYYRLAVHWEALGYPALGAMIVIYWLMVTKPVLW